MSLFLQGIQIFRSPGPDKINAIKPLKKEKQKQQQQQNPQQPGPKPVLTCLKCYYKVSSLEMDTVPLMERSLCLKEICDRVVAEETTGGPSFRCSFPWVEIILTEWGRVKE